MVPFRSIQPHRVLLENSQGKILHPSLAFNLSPQPLQEMGPCSCFTVVSPCLWGAAAVILLQPCLSALRNTRALEAMMSFHILVSAWPRRSLQTKRKFRKLCINQCCDSLFPVSRSARREYVMLLPFTFELARCTSQVPWKTPSYQVTDIYPF